VSNVVSIHSFRGGAGKSNITANLAALLARDGKRTAVIDTDIQSPGIHVILGLEPSAVRYCLNDYLWGNCSIEEASYDVSRAAGISDRSVLYLIPSSLKTGAIARILREGYDVALLTDGFQRLIRTLDLDYLLIDTHPGVNEETLLSIAISDLLVVVMRPDSQDFQGTAVTVELARKLDVARMLLVINKVPQGVDFAALKTQAETAFGIEVAETLPLSSEVARAGSRGVFCIERPGHAFSRGVSSLTRRLSAPAMAGGIP
jgi:MinD-like ATPase involved in chromosome partitioning or flagellar assembly